jgi:dephospho-CoA kinase
MKILGVTGNIGSGKSLFCSFLNDLGAEIFHADAVAKHLMTTNMTLKSQIVDAFGENAYSADGQLNRQWLAEQAFKHNKAYVLNDIVHPAVVAETRKRAELARVHNCPLFVKEAALLLNDGRSELFDYIIWIQSPLQTRIERVQKRDNADVNDILQRDEKQKKLPDIAEFVDEIVINDGTKDDFKRKAAQVFYKLVN